MIVAAVDIGGTKIAVGLVDERGTLLGKTAMPTAPADGLADGIKRITQAILRLQNEAGVEIQGLGVACTGPVNPFSGELAVNNFLPGWEGTGLVEALSSQFSLPVAMENDADAAALAECRWGSGAGCRNFIYLTVSTGIGGGVILDGKLYRGVEGAHPEIGHHTLDPAGPRCFCGAYGCWEALAAGPALAKWYRSHTQAVGDLDARQICELARSGDPLACQTVAREAKYLGIGLANLITLFTPECISLGGGVMKSWDLFESAARSVIRTNCGLVPYQKTAITFSQLGIEVNLLGAGQAWFHRYLR
jgi:glucokinase